MDPRFGRVERSRKRFLRNAGIDNYVRMNAQNSDKIVTIGGDWHNIKGVECDVLFTKEKGLALECDPADCAVYIMFNPIYNILGLIHAGREGSFKDIIEKAVDHGAKLSGVGINNFVPDLQVIVSPAICFEHYRLDKLRLDNRVLRKWERYLYGELDLNRNNGFSNLVSSDGTKIMCNFLAYNRAVWNFMGIAVDNSNYVCTYESKDYFSHRRFSEQKEKGGIKFALWRVAGMIQKHKKEGRFMVAARMV